MTLPDVLARVERYHREASADRQALSRQITEATMPLRNIAFLGKAR